MVYMNSVQNLRHLPHVQEVDDDGYKVDLLY